MDTADTLPRLLTAWRTGDTGNLDALLPLVYDELHALAQRRLRSERADHTLQPTALVHEAFLRLAGSDVTVHDRVHFVALAAGTMRRVLVDHAKARRRAKRGAGAGAVPLDEALHVAAAPDTDIEALDEALADLQASDARKARVVELHYFGGLTYDEIAEVLGVGVATVNRDLRFAKAWLHQRLR